ncbi:MAG: hypothetical protein MHM6MM_007449 [Cercozoa sp. M6MM]
MKLLASLAALQLAVRGESDGGLLRVENGVLVCSERHWNDCIEEQPFSLVSFSGPPELCEECAETKSVLEELATSLKQEDLTVASVDCEKYEPICQKLRVPGLPSLLLFDHGQPALYYRGPRDRTELERWTRAHMQPLLVSLQNPGDLKAALERYSTLLVIGTSRKQPGSFNKRLEPLARALRDVDLKLGVAVADVVFAERMSLKLSEAGDAVVRRTHGDDVPLARSLVPAALGEPSQQQTKALHELLGRVVEASFGSLDKLDALSAKKYASRGRPVVALLGDPRSKSFEDKATVLQALQQRDAEAVAHLSFAWLHPDSELDVAKRMRSQREELFNNAQVFVLTEEARWHFDGDSVDSLRDWVLQWKADPATQQLQSESKGEYGDYVDAPKYPEAVDEVEESSERMQIRLNPLVKVRGDTWQQLLQKDGVLGDYDALRSRDRIVLMCDADGRVDDSAKQPCQEALQEFRQLATHFGPSVSGDDGVLVGFIDSGRNEVYGVQMSSSPVVLFFPAGTHGAEVTEEVPHPQDKSTTVTRTHKDFLVYRDRVEADDLITFICSLGERVDEEKSCVVEVALKPGEEMDEKTKAMLDKLYEDVEEEEDDNVNLEEAPGAPRVVSQEDTDSPARVQMDLKDEL